MIIITCHMYWQVNCIVIELNYCGLNSIITGIIYDLIYIIKQII